MKEFAKRLGVLVGTVAALGLILVVILNLQKSDPTQAELEEILPELDARVEMSVSHVRLKNTSRERWGIVELTIDGEYVARDYVGLQPGEETRISLSDFVDGHQNRFQPLLKRAKYVSVHIPNHKTAVFQF